MREHDNPTGYVTELVKMQAEVRSDETTDLSATNQPIQGRIQIIKRDQLTKEALAGAGLPSPESAVCLLMATVRTAKWWR